MIFQREGSYSDINTISNYLINKKNNHESKAFNQKEERGLQDSAQEGEIVHYQQENPEI